MSRNYKIHDPKGLYFLTFATVGWIDVFTRPVYKDISDANYYPHSSAYDYSGGHGPIEIDFLY